MNILKVLHHEHLEAVKLLKELDGTTTRAIKARTDVFSKLRQALLSHAQAEEKVLYGPLKEKSTQDAKNQMLEAYEEHHFAKVMIEEISLLPVDDETWLPKLTVLRENIEHHVEEEEGEIFAIARKQFDDETLADMGAEYLALKQMVEETIVHQKQNSEAFGISRSA